MRIKFTMSNGDTFSIPFDQAEKIIDSPGNLFKVMESGKWTGKTINKSWIMDTDIDFEEPRPSDAPRLPMPKFNEEDWKRGRKKAEEVREKLKNKFGWGSKS